MPPVKLHAIKTYRVALVVFALACIGATVYFVNELTPYYLRRETVDCYEHARSKVESQLVPSTAPNARSLIVVSCHAIWIGGGGKGLSESEWLLQPIQQGQQKTFVEHIDRGMSALREDPHAVLIFSGGQTNSVAGPISEAQSYYSLAQSRGLLSSDKDDFSLRVTTEEFARDSYENLLFSICRFHEFTGQYPSSVTVISHDFKKERFTKLHRAAIRFPESDFHFIGIDPPGKPPVEGEQQNAFKPFLSDMYGCTNPTLVAKRVDRNPFRRRTPYFESCPELNPLMNFCDPDGKVYEGSLPWDSKEIYESDDAY